MPRALTSATLFNFDAGLDGDVTPFLAIDNGAGAYTAIAVGTDVAAVIGQDQSLPFGGSNTFTLGATTTVFAGIASDVQNPIFLDDGTGPFTDHEGGGQAASTYIVTLNGTVPGDGSFSNPDLNRTYAFSIEVEAVAVPEPSTLALGGLGVLGGLIMWRRRK